MPAGFLQKLHFGLEKGGFLESIFSRFLRTFYLSRGLNYDIIGWVAINQIFPLQKRGIFNKLGIISLNQFLNWRSKVTLFF